jgi:hypothetical protein
MGDGRLFGRSGKIFYGLHFAGLPGVSISGWPALIAGIVIPECFQQKMSRKRLHLIWIALK